MLTKISTLPVLLILSVLTACAQPKIVVQEDTTIGSVPNTVITINDIRPETDKEYTIGSLMVFKSNYGIWTLGDDMFEPPVLNLLRRHIMREIAKWEATPSSIDINLKRLKFEANHQADLLATSSTQLGPLGVVIAESMHGKDFETNLSKTEPFVLGFIDAEIKVSFGGTPSKSKSLSTYKAENFSSHMDSEGRMEAAKNVLNKLFSNFAISMG